MVADNVAGGGGEGFTSHPPSNPSLSSPPRQTISISASQDTPAVHSSQISSRRSPRSVDSYKGDKDNSDDHNKPPAKKNPRTSSAPETSPPSSNDASFFIGDPVPDEEARRRWPWRYDCEGPRSDGLDPKTKDDDDTLVLNVKCHYLQAKIETHVFDLGDCATVKGEGDHDHVGRILEFFKTNDNEDFFRVQWFFRAEDTVIKDASSSNDKKRLFYSTLMNDNALDCILSKVKVVKIQPGVNLKSIPVCDYYYDMKYNIDYSTFSTIKDDVSSNNCCLSASDNKEGIINSNGIIDNNSNETITDFKPQKLELTLLDMYSGCGGMSTGLRFGAKLSGVDLSTKWAVDANEDACESLRLNHPDTQIRNESAKDFLDLIKEWDKLCKKFPVKKKRQRDDTVLARPPDDVIPSKEHNIVPKNEYEVEKLVDVCYSELSRTSKRGLKFKVRWAGYGPSDDTWEPIEELSKCKDKIREFVQKGIKANKLPRPGDVGIICGGPPCQGISGHNRHRNFESPLEDERNYQIVVFMEIINFLKPKYILMENVVDILRFANGCLARYAINCLVHDYYQVRLGIMAAGCYGLPQFRLRVFLWGARADVNLPPFPLPTHDVVFKHGGASGFERNIVAYDEGQFPNLEKCVFLKDAISDLPPVSNTESRDKMTYTSAPETEFQKFIRATKSDMLGIASVCEVKKPLLHDHRPLPLNEDDYLRVCRVPKRKGANFRDLPGVVSDDNNVVSRTSEPELMPSGKHWVPDYALNFRRNRNTRSFARLWWDETVSTVLCTPNFRAEAMLHPEQDRVLTIRESARLQGFPDYYALSGSVNERYRQVGNAVAVPVGRALGYTLGMALQKLTGDEPLITLPPKFAHSTTLELLRSRQPNLNHPDFDIFTPPYPYLDR